MVSLLDNSLFETQKTAYNIVSMEAKEFYEKFCGVDIIRDDIFNVIQNYVKKMEHQIELLRYPFKDEELRAFTFVKKGTIFVCLNSEIELCKQVFAITHELYHIYCYIEKKNQHIILNGSILDSKTADEQAKTQEDKEANAFAGLLLMPEESTQKQFEIYGIDMEQMQWEDVLRFM